MSLQDRLATPGILRIARGLSHFGEHSLGWLGLGFIGALVDKNHRGRWFKLMAAAFVSHALSVVVKRIVRRKRPHDPRIQVGVGTPSELSFPSSHATSTTAALVTLAKITRNPLPLLGVPVMMLSRMVLGVHYPHRCAGRRNCGSRNRAGYRPESCQLWPMWGSRGATERRIAHEREAREVRIRG